MTIPAPQLLAVRPADKIRAELREHAHAHANNILFDQLLRRYAVERVLYRMCTMEKPPDMTLRGAWAIETRLGVPHRRWTTVQLQVTEARPYFAEDEAAKGLVTRCAYPGDDGLDFMSKHVRHALPSTGWPAYARPHRVKADVRLDKAVIPFELVVGFNEPVVPDADEMELNTLLDQPAPRLDVARFETLVAEKLKRIVREGVLRFRAKDYYDVWLLANTDPLDELAEAIEVVFRHRPALRMPDGVPAGLTDRFAESEHADWHWSVFLDRGEPLEKVGFRDVVAGIRERVMPVVEDLGAGGR